MVSQSCRNCGSDAVTPDGECTGCGERVAAYRCSECLNWLSGPTCNCKMAPAPVPRRSVPQIIHAAPRFDGRMPHVAIPESHSKLRRKPSLKRQNSQTALWLIVMWIFVIVIVVVCGVWLLKPKNGGPPTHTINEAAPSLEFGAGERVFYIDGATKSDASVVGRALKTMGNFDNTGEKIFILSRSSSEFVVTLVVSSERFNSLGESEISRFAQTIREGLSRLAFGKEPFEIVFCDPHLRPLRRFSAP